MARTPNKVERICKYCQKSFLIHPAKVRQGQGTYCGMDCFRKADSERRPKRRATAICKTCGKSFEYNSAENRGRIRQYCGAKCFHSRFEQYSNQKPDERFCLQCGKPIHVTPSRIGRGAGKYCSIECRQLGSRKHERSRNRGNKIYIYGRNWARQRKLAYRRDGGICQICGRSRDKSERQFDVHHIVKSKVFGCDHEAANNLSNLITLCPQCHSKAEHGLIPVPKRLL